MWLYVKSAYFKKKHNLGTFSVVLAFLNWSQWENPLTKKKYRYEKPTWMRKTKYVKIGNKNGLAKTYRIVLDWGIYKSNIAVMC